MQLKPVCANKGVAGYLAACRCASVQRAGRLLRRQPPLPLLQPHRMMQQQRPAQAAAHRAAAQQAVAPLQMPAGQQRRRTQLRWPP